MPEGDTVYRQCAMLDAALAGGVVTTSDLRVPQAATADLRGFVVDAVVPRGKHLLLRLMPPAGTSTPPLTLHSHLMMDGIWKVNGTPFRSSDTGPPPRTAHTIRIVLEVEHTDGRRVRAIAYDVKQVRLLPTEQEGELVGHLGPDLLDPDWGEAHRSDVLTRLDAEPERPIGLALLDQRIVAGIGNVYRSEVCFMHRVHPSTAITGVADIGRIIDLAQRLLTLNRDRSVRVTTGGMMGRDGDLWVYGRAGRPCRRCRTRIVREYLAEPRLPEAEARSVYVCPRCQPVPAAHDNAK